MSNNKKRAEKGLHLTRGDRLKIRNALRVIYGNKCCWCKKEMEFPIKKYEVKNLDLMATIEHYFVKNNPKTESYEYLRLSHKKCNQ